MKDGSGDARLSEDKPPTEAQMIVLRKNGVTTIPVTQSEASTMISSIINGGRAGNQSKVNEAPVTDKQR